MIQLVLAYALFIVILALPVLVPLLALGLVIWGAWLILRGQGLPPPAAIAAATLAFTLAGLLVLIVFGGDDRIPGTRALREIREAVALRQRAQRAMAPGGEWERMYTARHGKRHCDWARTPTGWEKTCRNDKPAGGGGR